MLIIPEKVILLATPRTGSRALEKSFLGGVSTQWDKHGNPRASGVRQHHVHPEDIEKVAEQFVPGSSSLPKVTVIRHPHRQLLSWYHHIHMNHVGEKDKGNLEGFLKFIKEADISWYFTPSLNPYREVADKIFPYESNARVTASAISRMTGAELTGESPRIGQSIGLNASWLSNEAVIANIKERFADDLELYRRVLNDQP